MPARVSQQNIYETPIWTRKRKPKYIPDLSYNAIGNIDNDSPKVIEYELDKIIECGAELTSTNYILITLKSEQEQGSEDANYELLNYIYDNFEEHTDFFKRIKLRFLEASFDFPKYNNIESNWVRLALKSYIKENDVWKVDAGKDMKDIINPTIRKRFIKPDSKTEEVDMTKYIEAERNVTAELRIYIPCFSKESRGLTRIWASLFNFTFIGEANEKNEQGFSQITINYNKAMEFLQSDEAKKYCQSNAEAELSVSDFMRFGQQEIVVVFSFLNTIKKIK